MHVDVPEFIDLVHGAAGELTSADQSGVLEVLAAGVHDTWRALGQKEGWKMQPNFDGNQPTLRFGS